MSRFVTVLAIVAAVALILFLFFMVIPNIGDNDTVERVEIMNRMQQSIALVAQITGLIIALLGALSLAFPSVEGRQAINVLTCALAVLAGVLIMGPLQWATALAFGLVAGALVLVAFFDRNSLTPPPGRAVVDVVQPERPGESADVHLGRP